MECRIFSFVEEIYLTAVRTNIVQTPYSAIPSRRVSPRDVRYPEDVLYIDTAFIAVYYEHCNR